MLIILGVQPIQECAFFSLYGDDFYATTFSFMNNSAGFKGSTLYGGQLNKCGLCFVDGIRIDKINVITELIMMMH